MLREGKHGREGGAQGRERGNGYDRDDDECGCEIRKKAVFKRERPPQTTPHLVIPSPQCQHEQQSENAFGAPCSDAFSAHDFMTLDQSIYDYINPCSARPPSVTQDSRERAHELHMRARDLSGS